MKKKRNYLKKKGMAMSKDMQKNPENYKNRVVVAYECNNNSVPYLYVLVGSHDHTNEHDIRKLYAKTVGVNYYDTRLVLYSTYVNRMIKAKKNAADIKFGNI